MRMLKFIVAPALILGLVIGLAALRAADDAPKYTIKEVMKMAHSGRQCACQEGHVRQSDQGRQEKAG